MEQRRWRRALCRELAYFAEEQQGGQVVSVFFGGGTPSLMDPDTVGAVLCAVREAWQTADDLEVTLEANPTSSERARFAAFRSAGVNRVSVGVQSFNDDGLSFLGRTHDAAEARSAVADAMEHFGRYSFDLIYGLPGQTAASWHKELIGALTIVGEHLSVYQLAIEPGTDFFRNGVRGSDSETGADLYDVTQEILSAAGLPAYEISNHALPGSECRHNLEIWRGGTYLGIGPGAHGRISHNGQIDAVRQLRSPEKWLANVEAKGHGTAHRTRLDRCERAEELVLMGLRLDKGIEVARFHALSGLSIDDVLDSDAVQSLMEDGYLERDARFLRATIPGRRCLNAVLAQVLA